MGVHDGRFSCRLVHFFVNMLCKIRANLSMDLVAIGSLELEKLIVVWLKWDGDFDFAKNNVTKSVADNVNTTVEKL